MYTFCLISFNDRASVVLTDDSMLWVWLAVNRDSVAKEVLVAVTYHAFKCHLSRLVCHAFRVCNFTVAGLSTPQICRGRARFSTGQRFSPSGSVLSNETLVD